jgi:hypothetical protein
MSSTVLTVGDDTFDSKLCNCFIEMRAGETLFKQSEEGILANFDGYAIVPLEEVAKWVKDGVPENVREWAEKWAEKYGKQ